MKAQSHDLTLRRTSWYKDGAPSQDFRYLFHCAVTMTVKIVGTFWVKKVVTICVNFTFCVSYCMFRLW